MSMVWPCPLTVEAYASMGRRVEVPRPGCPSCSGPVVFWSGYWRHVRWQGRCRKIFVPRVRCGRCAVTHALLPAFVLARRLDAAGDAGAVIGQVAAGECGVRPAAARVQVPYTTARGWVRRFTARAGELAVSFPALAADLGGDVLRPLDPPARFCGRGDRGGVRGGGRAAGMGCAGAVAVRERGDRREPDRRQRKLALPDHRQEAFHASQEPMTGNKGGKPVDEKMREKIALHRWAVIAEAASERLSSSERGAVVRAIAAREHAHPDGTMRRYSRGTIDRWLRAHKAGGMDGLRPSPRSDTGAVRAMPELFGEAAALRLELPGRSAAQIASILYHRHGVRVAERTVFRAAAPRRAAPRRAGRRAESLREI